MIIRDMANEPVRCAAEYPVVTIPGPRQSGKTSLVGMTFKEKPAFPWKIRISGRTAMLILRPFSILKLRHDESSWNPFALMVRAFFLRLHEEHLGPG